MKNLKIILFIVIMPTVMFAQDMRQNSFSSLFSDHKAASVGDMITILVLESSQASNTQQTSAGKSSDLGLSFSGDMSGKALPSADAKIGTNNNFNGKGSTSSNGVFRTKISAIIDSVLPNGNMHVSGKRKIVINGEEQDIIISGLVRSSDIQADNSVLSYNLAEAEIKLDGSGMIERAQSPGWLTKLFHWLF